MATFQHQPSPAASPAPWPSMTTGGARRALDLYEKLEKVGEGTYGKVYRAREKAAGRIVALKKLRLPEDDEGISATVLREVSLLRMLSQDPHVVRLLDLRKDVNKGGQTMLYLVLEYMDTDLKKFIRGHCSNREKIPAATVKILMYRLCKGVAFVHGRGVLHRDLKPHNVLMDRKTMALKIADLGLSRAIVFPGQTCTHEVGLEPHGWYRAPEILLGATHYYMPADIWSVGCILLSWSLASHYSLVTRSSSSCYTSSSCWAPRMSRCGQALASCPIGTSTLSGSRQSCPLLCPVSTVMATICLRKCWNTSRRSGSLRIRPWSTPTSTM